MPVDTRLKCVSERFFKKISTQLIQSSSGCRLVIMRSIYYTSLMSFIIAGLGNPGEQYEGTRHNTGRIMLAAFAKAIGAEDFSFNKKINALTSEGEVGPTKEIKKKDNVTLVMPETFMNNSGKSIGPLVTTAGAAGTKANLKKAERLIVIYDDFNLPLGSVRISFNRSSGGHNGVESIIKAAKTEAFVRVRVGVAPATAQHASQIASVSRARI